MPVTSTSGATEKEIIIIKLSSLGISNDDRHCRDLQTATLSSEGLQSKTNTLRITNIYVMHI